MIFIFELFECFFVLTNHSPNLYILQQKVIFFFFALVFLFLILTSKNHLYFFLFLELHILNFELLFYCFYNC